MDKVLEHLLKVDPFIGLLCAAVLGLYLLHRHRIQDYKSSVETQRAVDQTLRDELTRLQAKTDRLELKTEKLEEANSRLELSLDALRSDFRATKEQLVAMQDATKSHQKNLRDVLDLIVSQVDGTVMDIARLSAELKSFGDNIKLTLGGRIFETERQLKTAISTLSILRQKLEI